MKVLHYLLSGGILMLLLNTGPAVHAQETRHNQTGADSTSIGEVNFNVDCSKEVREDFNLALGMLHHMMYATSRDKFKAITRADPNCAMAYWGIATTLFQPLWGTRPSQEELQLGWEHISQARESVDSEREKLLVEATAAFFREPETAEFSTRIQRWTDAMETVYKSYRDDPDVAAFYSLSRLTKVQFAENRAPLLDKAESILRDVFEQHPTHPGAIHYTIHATDVDGRAENALDIVEAYGKIAPAVPHALHMPTHIYVRLGDWSKVIEWNKRSAEAALDHPVNGAVSHHYLHAIDYLVYAYLQRGENEKAEDAYRRALAKDRYQASFVSAFHFAAIPARLAVERNDWKRAAELEPRTHDYLPWENSPWAEGLTWYAKGLGAVHTGDIASAEKTLQKLQQLRDRARESGADNMARYIEIDRRVLEGWIEHEKGNEEEAIKSMKSAARLERSVEKHPVTPGALQPSNEALGDLFTTLDRPSEALEYYEASDKIWPGRLNTLMGAALAAERVGKKQLSRSYIERLLQGARDRTSTPVGKAQSSMDN